MLFGIAVVASDTVTVHCCPFGISLEIQLYLKQKPSNGSISCLVVGVGSVISASGISTWQKRFLRALSHWTPPLAKNWNCHPLLSDVQRSLCNAYAYAIADSLVWMDTKGLPRPSESESDFCFRFRSNGSISDQESDVAFAFAFAWSGYTLRPKLR